MDSKSAHLGVVACHLHNRLLDCRCPQSHQALCMPQVHDGILGILPHARGRTQVRSVFSNLLASRNITPRDVSTLTCTDKQEVIRQEIQKSWRLLLLDAVQLYALLVVDVDVFPLSYSKHVLVVKGLHSPHCLLEMKLSELHRVKMHKSHVAFSTTNQHILSIARHGTAVRAIRQVERKMFFRDADTCCINDFLLFQPCSCCRIFSLYETGFCRLEHLRLRQAESSFSVRPPGLLQLPCQSLVAL
mmetsp:Transcript_24483/g.56812  ORF Transcript_24483/g.56812 Transcript_24483/m.56812 type:complete len:245 (-) Transcript_24483:332-1066(-)